MSTVDSLDTTHFVRDTCLCLGAQRAARFLARRFDRALKPLGLTSGQFSLLNAVNQESAPTMAQVARLLSADRTTLTAALKPLERAGLVQVSVDQRDRRCRRLALTERGRARLDSAFPVWRKAHGELEGALGAATAMRLRHELDALANRDAA
ncbi:MAG: MarR family winged helix-turn-helix transcriptional regulator [Caulobacteraceae bacterium]